MRKLSKILKHIKINELIVVGVLQKQSNKQRHIEQIHWSVQAGIRHQVRNHSVLWEKKKINKCKENVDTQISFEHYKLNFSEECTELVDLKYNMAELTQILKWL